MAGLTELKFSLTKNGYFKVADVIRLHPRAQVLANINGVHAGINLDKPQIESILSADAAGQVPQVWDDIKAFPDKIDALVFIAVIFSHHTLIEQFVAANTTEMRGTLDRAKLGDKVYTNLLDSMKKAGLCAAYIPAGTTQFDFNLTPLFDMNIGEMVKQILELKLPKTGWTDPGPNDHFKRTFYEQCFHFEFHKALGISETQFEDWLEGRKVERKEPSAVTSNTTQVSVSASLLAALATKPFAVMSGPTGTGKTRTVQQLARSLCPSGVPETFNTEFLPVEAGWTDGRHLLGYRNPFGKAGEHYSSTAVISLLLKANYPKYADIPFFLILDEMNLSYVEMYFSRFLSLMETVESGNTVPVVGKDDLQLMLRSSISDAAQALLIESALTSGGLFLTKNVYIVGTVNIDETTHMFSPKVLDRAFVLEVPTTLPSQKSDQFQLPAEDVATGQASTLSKYLLEARSEPPVKTHDPFLDDVYGKLGRFKFGPRVTAESQRYFASVKKLKATATCAANFDADTDTRDRLLMQKLLPKVYGNRGQAKPVVDALVTFTTAGDYKKSIQKLKSMQADLQGHGFTNFFSQS